MLCIKSSNVLLKKNPNNLCSFPQRLHDLLLPLCVRLQQQQSSSNVSADPSLSISGQYSGALTRRELYRYQTWLAVIISSLFTLPKIVLKGVRLAHG